MGLAIRRSMYLLINLADSDNGRLGTADVDMIALPCLRLDDMAQQLALKHYIRMQLVPRASA